MAVHAQHLVSLRRVLSYIEEACNISTALGQTRVLQNYHSMSVPRRTSVVRDTSTSIPIHAMLVRFLRQSSRLFGIACVP